MEKPDPVQLADPRADHARPGRLALIAISAGSCGLLFAFGLSRLLQGTPVPTQAARASLVAQIQENAAHPTVEQAVSSARSAPRPAATLASTGVPPVSRSAPLPEARDAGAARAEAANDPTAPAAAPPKATAPSQAAAPVALRAGHDAEPATLADVPSANAEPSKRRAKRIFEQGVLAYVRCDGSEQRGARFPCPRDFKLEAYVWRALEQLPSCTAADPGIGSAELRVTLSKTRAALSWRPPLSGPSLNVSALRPCAGEKLADARTRARLPQAVVSFRFSLK